MFSEAEWQFCPIIKDFAIVFGLVVWCLRDAPDFKDVPSEDEYEDEFFYQSYQIMIILNIFRTGWKGFILFSVFRYVIRVKRSSWRIWDLLRFANISVWCNSSHVCFLINAFGRWYRTAHNTFSIFVDLLRSNKNICS